MRRPEFIARQARHPTGWLGRALAHFMAFETAGANDAALELLHLREADRVLEIGFGHGRTITRAAERVPHGLVVGIDHADAALDAARQRCAELIARGRVQLHCADSAQLPFPDAAFDKALAVHTLYFWQPPGPHLGEIRRVLAPGGRLVLAFHPAGTRSATGFPAGIYTFHTVNDVHDLLAAAGFADIETRRRSAGPVFTVAHAARPDAMATLPPEETAQ